MRRITSLEVWSLQSVECIRKIAAERLSAMGMETTCLPLGSRSDQPHIPIYTSRNLETCKRCIVYVGESVQDIGILAGRLVDHDNIGTGTVLNMVQAIRASDPNDEVGIVIANPGQLLWWRRGRKALSYTSWHCIPRPTAVSASLPITSKNHVPRNYNAEEHIACVFDDLIDPLVDRGCRIEVIAAGNSGLDVVEFLQQDWQFWVKAIGAIAVTSGYVWKTEITDDAFGEFWGKVRSSGPDLTLFQPFCMHGANETSVQRARAYLVSPERHGTPLTGRERFGCNIYASGASDFVECVVPRAYAAILDYFKLVSNNPDYENVPLEVDELPAEPEVAQDPNWSDEEVDEQAVDESKSSLRVEEAEVDEKTLSRGLDAVDLHAEESTNGHAGGEGVRAPST